MKNRSKYTFKKKEVCAKIYLYELIEIIVSFHLVYIMPKSQQQCRRQPFFKIGIKPFGPAIFPFCSNKEAKPTSVLGSSLAMTVQSVQTIMFAYNVFLTFNCKSKNITGNFIV